MVRAVIKRQFVRHRNGEAIMKTTTTNKKQMVKGLNIHIATFSNFQYIPAERLKKGSLHKQLKDRAGRGLSLAIHNKTTTTAVEEEDDDCFKEKVIVDCASTPRDSFTFHTFCPWCQTHLHAL